MYHTSIYKCTYNKWGKNTNQNIRNWKHCCCWTVVLPSPRLPLVPDWEDSVAPSPRCHQQWMRGFCCPLAPVVISSGWEEFFIITHRGLEPSAVLITLSDPEGLALHLMPHAAPRTSGGVGTGLFVMPGKNCRIKSNKMKRNGQMEWVSEAVEERRRFV